MSLTRVKDLSSATKLTVDTNTLHADETDNRVGIGTTTPAKKIHVHESAAAGEGILLTNGHNVAGTYSDIKWAYSASDQSYGAGLRFKQVDTSHGGQLEFYTDNASGSYTEQMRINENGYVRKFNQPSFRAGTTTGYATGANPTTVVCSNVQHNVGNGYNSSNGTFTVPSPGTWLFGVHGNARDVGSSQASSVYAQIMKNGSRMAIYYNSDEPNSSWHQIQGVIILECATNDAITFSSGPYTYWDSSMWTQFYGYLLG